MKKIIVSCFLALGLAACGDLTDLNENPKATGNAPYTALFSNAQVSLADVLTSTNVNTNVFRLYAQQWTQVTYTDESNYNLTTRSIPDNFWDEMYTDVLRDLREADNLAQEVDPLFITEEQRVTDRAVIDIMAVYSWGTLLEIFGDVPYQSGLDIENLLPAYTPAPEIHADLIDRLNADIAVLEANAGVAPLASADLLYGGDNEMWLRFANSLKLRLGMLVADSDPTTAQSVVSSIDMSMLITDNSFNAEFGYVASPPHTNPVWVDVVQSGRNDFVPANTIVDLMNELEDPRRDDYFTLLDGEYLGDEYASGTSFASVSHIAPALTEQTYPGMLMSAAEINFYLAEAAARGWISGDAATYYEAGVTESFLQYGDSEEEAEAYLEQPEVAYTASSWSEEAQQLIGTQAYIALYNRGLEAWTQWRRLDYPIFNVPEDLTYADIPTRFTYPVGEQNLNTANYETAASRIGGDLKTTNLFWDVE